MEEMENPREVLTVARIQLSPAEEEGLNINLKKEIYEKRKASELLESQLAKNLEEYKLNMKEEIKQLKENKLEWAELNQAEAVRLHMYAKLRFQV